MDLTIRIQEKNGEYVASCPELDVHCFGPSKEKATDRLKSVIQFYFDSAQDIQNYAPEALPTNQNQQLEKETSEDQNQFLH